MDPKILLMAGLLVVLLVAFGNNPLEDGRPVVKDRFRQSLEDTLAKQNTAIDPNQQGILSSIIGDSAPSQPMPGGTIGTAPAMGLPGASIPQGPLPAQSGNPNNLPGSYPVQALPPNPFGAAADASTQQLATAVGNSAAGLAADQSPSFFLQDGRRIFFSGMRVFVLAKDGTLRPLRDGRYVMQSGDEIRIRNGKRVIRD